MHNQAEFSIISLMNRMVESRGELPINLNFSTFPSDATRVLYIRAQVARELERGRGRGTPVDDLIIEGSRVDLVEIGRRVRQPITFSLPTALLRVLSSCDPLRGIYLSRD